MSSTRHEAYIKARDILIGLLVDRVEADGLAKKAAERWTEGDSYVVLGPRGAIPAGAYVTLLVPEELEARFSYDRAVVRAAEAALRICLRSGNRYLPTMRDLCAYWLEGESLDGEQAPVGWATTLNLSGVGLLLAKSEGVVPAEDARAALVTALGGVGIEVTEEGVTL